MNDFIFKEALVQRAEAVERYRRLLVLMKEYPDMVVSEGIIDALYKAATAQPAHTVKPNGDGPYTHTFLFADNSQ